MNNLQNYFKIWLRKNVKNNYFANTTPLLPKNTRDFDGFHGEISKEMWEQLMCSVVYKAVLKREEVGDIVFSTAEIYAFTEEELLGLFEKLYSEITENMKDRFYTVNPITFGDKNER